MIVEVGKDEIRSLAFVRRAAPLQRGASVTTRAAATSAQGTRRLTSLNPPLEVLRYSRDTKGVLTPKSYAVKAR